MKPFVILQVHIYEVIKMNVPITQLTYHSANTSQHAGSESFTALNYIFILKLAII